jgi:hypothetical protein
MASWWLGFLEGKKMKARVFFHQMVPHILAKFL